VRPCLRFDAALLGAGGACVKHLAGARAAVQYTRTLCLHCPLLCAPSLQQLLPQLQILKRACNALLHCGVVLVLDGYQEGPVGRSKAFDE